MTDIVERVLIAVQNRERRNRLLSLAIVSLLPVTAAIALYISLAFYSWWLSLGLVLAWFPTAWFVARHGLPSPEVSPLEASRLVDSALPTKDRAAALLELATTSKDPSALAKGEFIAAQLRPIVAEVSDPGLVAPFVFTKRERLALLSSAVAVVLSILLIVFRPLNPLRAYAAKLNDIVEKNPDLPPEVQERVIELAQQLEQPTNPEDIAQALAATKEEIERSLSKAAASGTSRNGRSIELRTSGEDKKVSPVDESKQPREPQPTPTTPPRDAKASSSPEQQRQEQQQQQQQQQQ